MFVSVVPMITSIYWMLVNEQIILIDWWKLIFSNFEIFDWLVRMQKTVLNQIFYIFIYLNSIKFCVEDFVRLSQPSFVSENWCKSALYNKPLLETFSLFHWGVFKGEANSHARLKGGSCLIRNYLFHFIKIWKC